jgi:hypothetical protein
MGPRHGHQPELGFTTIQSCAFHMKKQRAGRIIITTSIRSGAQLLNTRSATNHALIGRVINQKDRHMFTMLTVIRKKPEVTTDDFRHFMEFEYGPTYSGLPQTRDLY